MTIHVANPADDVVALTGVLPIPGLGFLPVNAYLVQAEQPLLVDSGLPGSRADFLQALWSQIEPADLRWIYLTHPDRDHTGSLMEVLTAAPNARLITTFLGLGILSMEYQISPERVFLLNPGQSLDLGDRCGWGCDAGSDHGRADSHVERGRLPELIALNGGIQTAFVVAAMISIATVVLALFVRSTKPLVEEQGHGPGASGEPVSEEPALTRS
jgi:Metallo-beta-lactamase superfamily